MGQSTSGGGREPSSNLFEQNQERLGQKYRRDLQGRFGIPGKRGSEEKRHLVTDTPLSTAIEFFNKLRVSSNGLVSIGNGWTASFGKGITVTFRPKSTSDGSPAIDIKNVSRISDNYRIHFVTPESRKNK